MYRYSIHATGMQAQYLHSSIYFIGDAIKEGDIRLVGSRYLWEGRVEIFLFGAWGTVSDDRAGTAAARVVCRQLGYNTYYCKGLILQLQYYCSMCNTFPVCTDLLYYVIYV